MSLQVPFDEAKATQVAALLIHKSGDQINHLILAKLLYIVDREALRVWGRPVSGGPYASLPHGPVISSALNLARGESPRSYWSQHIEKVGNDIRLKEEPGDGALSQEEERLVELVFAKYGHWSPSDIRKLTHDEFQEWQDPGTSSRPIEIETILEAVGKSPDQVRAHVEELKHLNKARLIFGS